MSWTEFEACRLLLAEERFGSAIRQRQRDEEAAHQRGLRALAAEQRRERREEG